MGKRGWLVGTVVVITMVAATGCRTATEPATDSEQGYPGDFALVLTVLPQRFVDPADATQQPAQYVVEADRTLRVALGLGAHHGLYPPPTATLTPGEMTELYRLVRDGGLMNERGGVSGRANVAYEVTLTAESRTHHYTATAADSPATMALVQRLVALRGGT